VREARVEHKLKAEIEVLFVRIDTMEKTALQLQNKVREYNKKRDIANTKSTFIQLSNVKKQITRFNRLYQICSNMLDHVKEQAMMSSTSSVLQEFVSMHEDVVKECKLDTMVEQYRELHDNVKDAAEDLGYISESLARADEDEFSDENIALALDAFLAEETTVETIVETTVSAGIPKNDACEDPQRPPEQNVMNRQEPATQQAAARVDTLPEVPTTRVVQSLAALYSSPPTLV
jgi:hypothetical protein